MRIVKHAVGAFCLLAALLLGVLWVRSYWVGESLKRFWYADEGEYYVNHEERWLVGEGQLVWVRFSNGRPLEQGRIKRSGPELPLKYWRWGSPSLGLNLPWHGFAYLNEHDQSELPYAVHWTRAIAIPIWLPLLIFAAPAGWWLRGVLRRRRGAHECPNCGYDLRATPDRCPECGTPAAAAP